MHAFFGDDAFLVSIQHEGQVLLHVIEEQEHIAAGGDGARHVVLPAHRGCHAQHVAGVGNDHAVEAELALQ